MLSMICSTGRISLTRSSEERVAQCSLWRHLVTVAPATTFKAYSLQRSFFIFPAGPCSTQRTAFSGSFPAKRALRPGVIFASLASDVLFQHHFLGQPALRPAEGGNASCVSDNRLLLLVLSTSRKISQL